ncbi:MAG: hypothetical protein JWM90_575 [Thermoleophilia bacterium]|nr:hypothetical protein [Thermoleophilia bacterium]
MTDHASTGVATISTMAWTNVASADAKRSLTLMGRVTGWRSSEPSFQESVDVAAGWIDRARRAGKLPAELLDLAGSTLQDARSHVGELERLATQVARDANETGTLDHSRLAQLEHMADTLAAWSTGLRSVLDTERGDDSGAIVRLRAAVATRTSGGGLELLVAKL